MDRRAVYEIAGLFVRHGLIWAVVEDKVYAHQNSGASRFQPTKNAIYGLTEKGVRIAGWNGGRESPNGDARAEAATTGPGRALSGVYSNLPFRVYFVVYWWLRANGKNQPRDSKYTRKEHRHQVLGDACLLGVPVFVLHGFRWPRTPIRHHVILNDLGMPVFALHSFRWPRTPIRHHVILNVLGTPVFVLQGFLWPRTPIRSPPSSRDACLRSTWLPLATHTNP